jgi:hypothetical protein
MHKFNKMPCLIEFVLAEFDTHNEEFVKGLFFRQDIDNFDKFLEHLAEWACRDDPDMNIYKNSWYGVVQQYRGLLSELDSDYIDERSADWFGGKVQLRTVLDAVKLYFP